MKNRHLVLSDVHENQNSLMRFILKAAKSRDGFDDIWLLGDLFGHSEDAVGEKRLRRSFLSVLSDLSLVPIHSVFGNWEYWLMHPEKDRENEAQQNFIESLSTRRTCLQAKENFSGKKDDGKFDTGSSGKESGIHVISWMQFFLS